MGWLRKLQRRDVLFKLDNNSAGTCARVVVQGLCDHTIPACLALKLIWACSRNAHRAYEKSLAVKKGVLMLKLFTKQYGSTFVPTTSANRSIWR